MLRLMGLPHVARFPKATVTLHEGVIEILFQGGESVMCIEIPLWNLGRVDDLETVELSLLARLQQLGYQVERQPSST